jgi:hypothetical protein
MAVGSLPYDMRHLLPLLVASAAIATGLALARARSFAGAAQPVVRHPALVATVAVGLAVVGVALLAIGWWAWAAVPAGVSSSLAASVAYVGAAMELFFAATLVPSASRASGSENPS